MDAQYVQNLRYKLQRRFRRLNSARWEIYHSTARQFWRYINDQPALRGILDDLLAQCPSAAEDAAKIVEQNETILGKTELECAALGANVLRLCSDSASDMPETGLARIYSNESKHSDNQRYFTDVFVEPLYEYLDEHLDDRGAVLALLRSYKHKVEWFNRQRLFDTWQSDPARGEKKLALHLYEYLHDQGLRFFIEPTSASGEADLVAAQQSQEPLIADAKIFNPDKSKSGTYLAKGFKQLYTYCVDFNESVGYLVIYKTCPEDLKFAMADTQEGTPLFILNNKTIFFVLIDIYPHEQSASKRGTMRAVEISPEDLVSEVKRDDA